MNRFISFLLSLAFLTATTNCLIYAESDNDTDPIVVRLKTENSLQPLYLAKFKQEGMPFPQSYVNQLESILKYDLEHNGMTTAVTQSPIGEKAIRESLGIERSPQTWKSLNVLYVIQTTINADKTLSTKLLTVNTLTLKNLNGIMLSGDITTDRKIIHQLADAIYKSLFNRDGIATTRILYTIKKKNGLDSKKWLSDIWECDYDGANSRQIVKDLGFHISPVYVPPKPGFNSGSFFLCFLPNLAT